MDPRFKGKLERGAADAWKRQEKAAVDCAKSLPVTQGQYDSV